MVDYGRLSLWNFGSVYYSCALLLFGSVVGECSNSLDVGFKGDEWWFQICLLYFLFSPRNLGKMSNLTSMFFNLTWFFVQDKNLINGKILKTTESEDGTRRCGRRKLGGVGDCFLCVTVKFRWINTLMKPESASVFCCMYIVHQVQLPGSHHMLPGGSKPHIQ